MKTAFVIIFCIYCFLIQAQNKAVLTDFSRKPVLRWSFDTRKPIYSSPVADAHTLYLGGNDSTLHALDLKTGNERWRFRSGGEIRSAVCLSGNRLYLNGGDGFIRSMDTATGKKLWEFQTDEEKKYDFADYFHSTTALAGNILYIGSGDMNLYALDPVTGKLIWKFTTGGNVQTTPVVVNDKVCFGSFDGFVYALDAASGKLLWKFKTVGHRFFPKGEVQGSPVASDKLFFVGARDYNLYALDQVNGFCHWNKAFPDGWGLSNTIYNSRLFTACADERRLIASDPVSGKEYWNVKTELLIFGGIAFTDSMLYVGTTIGKLHGYSKRTGLKIWSFETESYQRNKDKYFKADDSYRDDIYSIIKSNEQFLEVECELGGIFTAPVLSGKYLIFSSTNGKLYCLEEPLR
jgi:outer membrane protein assembly factor BamB